MKVLLRLIFAIVILAGSPRLMAQAIPLPSDAAPTIPTESLITPAPQPQLLDLIPTYPVENMQRALDFYTNKLGFSIVLQSGGTYASVGRDFVQIGLALSKGAAKGPKSSSYVNMNSIDVFYQTLVARGVKMARELKTQPSKMREFAVVDPDGNTLTFGEYTGPK